MGQMSDFDFKTHPSPVRDQIWVENKIPTLSLCRQVQNMTHGFPYFKITAELATKIQQQSHVPYLMARWSSRLLKYSSCYKPKTIKLKRYYRRKWLLIDVRKNHGTDE